jgi:hypothetical protein
VGLGDGLALFFSFLPVSKLQYCSRYAKTFVYLEFTLAVLLYGDVLLFFSGADCYVLAVLRRTLMRTWDDFVVTSLGWMDLPPLLLNLSPYTSLATNGM